MKSILIGTLAAILAAGAQSNEAERQLKAAMNAELVNGDLKAVIKQYAEIAAKYKNDRGIAAMALVRMAGAYQKLGDAEARKIYERVVKEYADQKQAVAMARAQLGGEVTAAAGGNDIRSRRLWSVENIAPLGTISPDGRRISFVDWRNGGRLAVRNLATGAELQLTPSNGTAAASEFAASSVFSPDGTQVAYTWLNSRGRYDLRVIGLPEGGNPRVLFDSSEVFDLSACSWSPDGRSIAVTLRRGDNTPQIGLVSVGDGALRIVKSLEWRGPGSVFFSPDGKWLAYDVPATQDSPERDVFVIAVDGSHEAGAVTSSGNDVVMGWTPDGKHLLFASDRGGSLGLWAVAFRDGKPERAPRRIKPDLGTSRSMGVTHDGSLFLAYGGIGGRESYIASVDFETGKVIEKPRLLSDRFLGNNPWANWSRDGKQIAYTSRKIEGGVERQVLVIQSRESGESRELRPNLAWMYETRWSPDGRSFITNAQDMKGKPGLYQVDAASGETRYVCDGSFAQWRSDGRSIVYLRFDDNAEREDSVIVERDLSSGTEREIWRTKATLFQIRISPDGREAAVNIREEADRVLLVVPNRGRQPP